MAARQAICLVLVAAAAAALLPPAAAQGGQQQPSGPTYYIAADQVGAPHCSWCCSQGHMFCSPCAQQASLRDGWCRALRRH